MWKRQSTIGSPPDRASSPALRVGERCGAEAAGRNAGVFPEDPAEVLHRRESASARRLLHRRPVQQESLCPSQSNRVEELHRRTARLLPENRGKTAFRPLAFSGEIRHAERFGKVKLHEFQNPDDLRVNPLSPLLLFRYVRQRRDDELLPEHTPPRTPQRRVVTGRSARTPPPARVRSGRFPAAD